LDKIQNFQGETADGEKPVDLNQPENPYFLLDQLVESASALACEDNADNKGAAKSGEPFESPWKKFHVLLHSCM
jgi:hypothetical protein